MGAVAVGATVYFGSEQSDRQIQEIALKKLRRQIEKLETIQVAA